MTPHADGTHKIADHIRALWANKATKDEAINLFAGCNYNPDMFKEN